MIIAGKCPPEPEELRETYEKGFENIELYLEREHLDQIEKTKESIRDSGLNVVSIHTPHAHIDDEKNYFSLADQLANELDAYLVIHSQHMHHINIPQLEALSLDSERGYENNPGISKRYLEESILNLDHNLVLDVAHFYMAHPENYIQKTEEILEAYSDEINLIHLCDSTTVEDGLAFGTGEMNMEKISQIIDRSDFDGILVLEVMPQHQEEAREKLDTYLNN